MNGGVLTLKPEIIVAIPLRIAVLCLSCEYIYPIQRNSCPKCNDSHFMSLGRVLERKPNELGNRGC